MELYCWPKAGGTNPNEIRELQTRRVNIFFSDSLHMKLYWSQRGTIITSANLSTYALGSGGLKEIGVLLPGACVNIDKIIQSIDPREVEEKDVDLLETEHKEAYRKNPNLFHKSKKERSFVEWYKIRNHGGKWKFASYELASVRLSKKGREILEKEHGSTSYKEIMDVDNRDYEQDDWILCYEFNGRKPVRIEWMYAHHVIPALRKHKGKPKRYHQVIQVNKLKAYGEKPFEIDMDFRKAFVSAYEEYYKENEDKIYDDVVPSKELLNLIYEKITK